VANGPPPWARLHGLYQSFWAPMMSAVMVIVTASDYDGDLPAPFLLNAVSTSRNLDFP